MPNTYSQITIQLVFAVKGRENILRDEFRTDVFKYISGVIKLKEQTPLAVNDIKIMYTPCSDYRLLFLFQKLRGISKQIQANGLTIIN